MNARLAARLTGWHIDIKSESTFAREEESDEYGDETESGVSRCAAMLRTGKRCPNAAVAGTRYCALPAHARFVEVESSLGRPLTAEETEEASTAKGWERISGLAAAPVAATGDVKEEGTEG